MEMQRIISNVSGLVRNEVMEGREYLVVPMIMMVEGVLNGSCGPLYYPAEELSKIPEVWNLKPVVVNHPTFFGKALSACSPEVVNQSKVGVIMNARWAAPKLHAEAWLEKSRLSVVDARVLNAVATGQMMEVSTGLFTDNEVKAGTFNGAAYEAIARNYRPDHLAILPDQIGACSIADGAGLLRINSSNRQQLMSTLNALGLLDNELSHDATRRGLYDVIDPKRTSDTYIEDVFDTYLIFSRGGKYWYQEYEEKNNKLTLKGVAKEVTRKIVYQDVSGNVVNSTFSGQGETDMKKSKMIEALVGNESSGFSEEDKPALEAMDEKVLAKVYAKAMPTEEGTEEPAPKTNAQPPFPPKKGSKAAADEEDPKKPAPKTNAAPAAPTIEEYVANAPAPIRDLLLAGMTTLNKTRQDNIGTIKANANNSFTDEQLNAMPAAQLEALAKLAAPAAPAPDPLASQIHNLYGGQWPTTNSTPTTNAAGKKAEALVAPTMNFREDAAK